MNYLIRSATIIDPRSAYHLTRKDLLIERGIITKIGAKIANPKKYKEVKSKQLHVSLGWVDMVSQFNDPGLEHKEDLLSGTAAAAAGGFTHVCTMPNTEPVVDSKSQVEYILNKTRDTLTAVHPIGAVSLHAKGEEITEIYDMRNSGAIAFSDGVESGLSAGLTLRSLQYVKPFNGLLITMPDDHSLRISGQMNEGEMSTLLGMKGIPELGETIVVKRDLDLLQYTDSRLHFGYISAIESVDLIKKAKKTGQQVSCSIPAYLLAWDEEVLGEYDTNYKVLPPLRDKATIKKLIAGLKDGTIDTIASFHLPQDIESKEREFDTADFGMIGLQTTYALVNEVAGKQLGQEVIVDKLSTKPREILNLPETTIEEGVEADLTLFDPSVEWTFNKEDNRSKSANYPAFGATYTGKVIGSIHRNQIHLND